MTPPSVLFLDLATCSRVGGPQNSNRRVSAKPWASFNDRCTALAVAGLTDDVAADLPQIRGVTLPGFCRDHLAMIRKARATRRRAGILPLGPVNPLPVAHSAGRLDDLLLRTEAARMGERGPKKVRNRCLNAHVFGNIRSFISGRA